MNLNDGLLNLFCDGLKGEAFISNPSDVPSHFRTQPDGCPPKDRHLCFLLAN